MEVSTSLEVLMSSDAAFSTFDSIAQSSFRIIPQISLTAKYGQFTARNCCIWTKWTRRSVRRMGGPFSKPQRAVFSLFIEPCFLQLQWHCLPGFKIIRSSHLHVRSSLCRHHSGANSPLALPTTNLLPLYATVVSGAGPSLLHITHKFYLYDVSNALLPQQAFAVGSHPIR